MIKTSDLKNRLSHEYPQNKIHGGIGFWDRCAMLTYFAVNFFKQLNYDFETKL